MDRVFLDWLDDYLPILNFTLLVQRDSVIFGEPVRFRVEAISLFLPPVSWFTVESQLPDTVLQAQAEPGSERSPAAIRIASSWRKPNASFSFAKDELIPDAVRLILPALLGIDVMSTRAYVMIYAALALAVRDFKMQNFLQSAWGIIVALAIQDVLKYGLLWFSKSLTRRLLPEPPAGMPKMADLLEGYLWFSLLLSALLCAVVVAVEVIFSELEAGLPFGLDNLKKLLITAIVTLTELAVQQWLGVNVLKSLAKKGWFGWVLLIINVLDDLASIIESEQLMRGLEALSKVVSRDEAVIAALATVLLAAAAFAVPALEFSSDVGKVSAVPEASLPSEIGLVLFPARGGYAVAANISLQIRDPDGLNGAEIRDVVIALVNKAGGSWTPGRCHVVEDHGSWHVKLEGYQPIGWFDLRYDPNDPNSPLKLNDSNGDGELDRATVNGTFVAYDHRDTPPKYKRLLTDTWGGWKDLNGSLYLAVFAYDSDGNEVCWLVPARIVGVRNATLSGSSAEAVTKGPVTVVIPDGDDLAVGLDSPACFGYLSGRWPTVIIEGPSVYEVGGRRYSSNATVAICIKSEWYRLQVLEPERHSVSVAPSWTWFLSESLFVTGAFAAILLLFRIRRKLLAWDLTNHGRENS